MDRNSHSESVAIQNDSFWVGVGDRDGGFLQLNKNSCYWSQIKKQEAKD